MQRSFRSTTYFSFTNWNTLKSSLIFYLVTQWYAHIRQHKSCIFSLNSPVFKGSLLSLNFLHKICFLSLFWNWLSLLFCYQFLNFWCISAQVYFLPSRWKVFSLEKLSVLENGTPFSSLIPFFPVYSLSCDHCSDFPPADWFSVFLSFIFVLHFLGNFLNFIF